MENYEDIQGFVVVSGKVCFTYDKIFSEQTGKYRLILTVNETENELEVYQHAKMRFGNFYLHDFECEEFYPPSLVEMNSIMKKMMKIIEADEDIVRFMRKTMEEYYGTAGRRIGGSYDAVHRGKHYKDAETSPIAS